MAVTQASSCGCDSTTRDAPGSLTGRMTTEPVRNYWPDHNLEPRTNFISERHRVALMWRL